MNKIFGFIKEYLIAIFILLVLGALLKIGETVYLINLKEGITFKIFSKSIISLFITYSFYSLLLLPVYLLFNFFNKTLARIFLAIVFSLLILIELGLTIYFFQTGTLIGAELVIRPIFEVMATIKTVVSLWLPIFGIIFTVTAFYFILSFLGKKTINNKLLLLFSIFLIIFGLLIKLPQRLHRNADSPVIKNYIQNKSAYSFYSIITYFPAERKNSAIAFDDQKIEEFILEYPERKIIDNKYPLEREYRKNNVLAPYFKPSTQKPNIVIVVLESLGREWNFPNESGVSLTPFLDSLANTGLYWKNCITSTKRSFGVVPSITGSVPFGVKGFQFGNMPEHNSLIKFLKLNDYKTNCFYAGAFYFDAINDYLLAQDIDYMSENYYIDFEKNKTNYNGVPYWGYHDSIMFAKVLQDANFTGGDAPLFNLFVTTSAHQDVDKNNPYFQKTYQLVSNLIASIPKDKQEYYVKRMDRVVTFYYQDMCLRSLFEHYKKRGDFENTIFVFTGDHSSGMMQKNDLSLFHVPLIIWSPLLVSHKTFPALVSHNDLVPTLENLLSEYYHLKPPQYSHWMGDVLDTSSHFASRVKKVMFDYSSGFNDLIYNNYFYNGRLYEIQNENLDLKEIHNDSLAKVMQNKLELYKYVHKYVYLNNKLTHHPLFHKTPYKTIKNEIIPGIMPVNFKKSPHWESIVLFPETKIEGKWEKIRISVTAEIMFLEIPENEDFYEFIIECKGQNMQNADYYHDVMNNFIMEEKLEAQKWYPLQVEKMFLVDGATDLRAKLFFCMGSNRAGNYSKLKDVRVLIEGDAP